MVRRPGAEERRWERMAKSACREGEGLVTCMVEVGGGRTYTSVRFTPAFVRGMVGFEGLQPGDADGEVGCAKNYRGSE
jgi:hypothetical protein